MPPGGRGCAMRRSTTSSPSPTPSTRRPNASSPRVAASASAVRVEGGRVEALVLPELRQHLARGGDESRPGPVPVCALAHEGGHRPLVVRVGVAVQEAHRDRGARRQAVHRGACLIEVERTQDSAVPGHAFVDLQRAAARNEGRGFQGGDVVEDRAVGAGDLEHVPEPDRGQHPDLGPASLQDRVRADGDAVDEALHFPEIDAEARGTTTPTDGSVARAEHARRSGRRALSTIAL